MFATTVVINVFEIYCKQIIDGVHISGNSKLSGQCTLLRQALSELRDLTGIDNPYEDIINLPHQKSSKHPHMPRCNRAAQFSPFAALKGYDAAIRELQEETGYKALNMTKVSDFYTSPGFSTEMIHLYYTSDFIISKLPEENEEHITALWFTVEEIESEIMAGNIKDGKTILAYYWYCVKRINHATICD